MKRKLPVFVSVLVLLFLTACAGLSPGSSSGQTPSSGSNQSAGSSGEQTNVAKADDGNVVEIRTAWFGSVARHELFNKLMDQFEAENPGIKVLREYTDWGGYFEKLTTQAAGGNVPDVFQLTPLHIAEYAERGVPMELDEFVESGKIDLSDWDPKIVDTGKYKGKLYMVTIGMSAPAMFVNVDLLKRAGVSMPETDLSWEQFSQFVKEIQGKLSGGTWALFDTSGNFDHFVIYIIQKGKTITSADGKSLGFDKEDVVEWLNWWDDLRKSGAVPPADVMAEDGSKPWEDSMMVHQKIAIQATNGNQLKIFQKYMEDKVEIMRLPTMPEGKNKYGEVFTGVYLLIPKTSKHPEEAAKLIDFWVNNIEANKLYNYEHGVIGSNKVNQALEPQLTEEDKKVIKHFNDVINTAPAAIERPPGYSAISAEFDNMSDQVAFMKSSAEQAADTFMKEAEKLLNR